MRERWYMLTVKAKFAGTISICVHQQSDVIFVCLSLYAEGHYMASRLSKAITKESEKINMIINDYNLLVPPSEYLLWERVTDLTRSSLTATSDSQSNAGIPRSVRMEAIESFCKMQRAVEECALLHQEMENVVRFHCKQYKTLSSTITQLCSPCSHSRFLSGAVCLLRLRQGERVKEISDCVRAFPDSSKFSELLSASGIHETTVLETPLVFSDGDLDLSVDDDQIYMHAATLDSGSASVCEGGSEEFACEGL